jgi:hypothetical protein
VTVAEGEGEATSEEGGKKKGGKKKLIMMIVLIVVIGYVVASQTVLKAPPLTAAQVKAKEEAATQKLDAMCALANGLEPPKPESSSKAAKSGATTATTDTKTTPTTMAPPSLEGEVLVVDSVTVNLVGSHFLKLGLGFKLPVGVLADTAKTENLGAPALNYVLTELRKKSQNDLGPNALEPLRQKLGYAICSSEGKPPNPSMKYEGKILTIYFTDFVSQ